MDEMTHFRYAITLKKIVQLNPCSWLALFKSSSCIRFLNPSTHGFLIHEEGNQSQKILTKLLGSDRISEAKIKTTAAGLVAFKKKEYIEKIKELYEEEFESCVNACLYRSGYHQYTKEYSIANHIESDHTLPYNVWKRTVKDSDLKKALKKQGITFLNVSQKGKKLLHSKKRSGADDGYFCPSRQKCKI